MDFFDLDLGTAEYGSQPGDEVQQFLAEETANLARIMDETTFTEGMSDFSSI